MEYTDVIIRSLPKDDGHGLKAVVSLVIDDNEFAIHNVKLVKGPERWFVAMPSETILKRGFEDRYDRRDIVHPIGPLNRAKLELAVFKRYQEEMSVKSWLYDNPQYESELLEVGAQLEKLITAG